MCERLYEPASFLCEIEGYSGRKLYAIYMNETLLGATVRKSGNFVCKVCRMCFCYKKLIVPEWQMESVGQNWIDIGKCESS